MSAETLRRAAALMRERAEAAAAADHMGEKWIATPCHDPENNGWRVDYSPEVDGFDDTLVHAGYDYEGTLAAHLAGWHPIVALAVATSLDEAADHLDVDHWAPGAVICGAALEGLDCSVLECALAIARAYLEGGTR